jgi:hypothetical protein
MLTLDGWDSAPFSGFIYTQAESCSRSFVHARPPASTDYCSCQVLRENHFSCGFPSATGPKTKSADRDLALRQIFSFFKMIFFIFRECFATPVSLSFVPGSRNFSFVDQNNR